MEGNARWNARMPINKGNSAKKGLAFRIPEKD